jgi:hypothetical protein
MEIILFYHMDPNGGKSQLKLLVPEWPIRPSSSLDKQIWAVQRVPPRPSGPLAAATLTQRSLLSLFLGCAAINLLLSPSENPSSDELLLPRSPLASHAVRTTLWIHES